MSAMISVVVPVPAVAVAGMMESALEGASSHWLDGTKARRRRRRNTPWVVDWTDEQLHVDVIVCGGALCRITRASLQQALAMTAIEYPEMFARVLSLSATGVDADHFAQLCVFGRIVHR